MKLTKGKPLYLKIAEQVQLDILSGYRVEGEHLPTIRQYASEMQVNPNTIIRSYHHLKQGQLILQKRGLGLFIAPGAREKLITSAKIIFWDKELPAFFNELLLLEIDMAEIVKLYEDYRRITIILDKAECQDIKH